MSDVNLRVRVSTEGTGELDRVNSSLEDMGSSSATASKGLKGLVGAIVPTVDVAQLASKAISLTGEAITTLGNVAVNAAKQAIAFEKALTDIKTISPATDMKALSEQLLSVSAAWGIDKISAAAAQYDIMSSGITDAGDAFKVFEGAAKLAAATGVSVAEAAPTITAALNAWGMSADEVGTVMDSLAITTQDGVVRMGELGPVFGQVAATAAGAGVGLQELNAGIAALTLGGTPAAQAGTQLKAVIAGLLKPSEELAKAFEKQAGQSTAAFLQTNGLAKTLEVLKVVTKGSAEETSRLFGSQEAVSGLLPLITTQSENFTKSLNKQNDAIGKNGKATEEMAKIVQESADFQLKKLSSTMDALSTDIGNTFVPAITQATKFLVEAAEGARTFLKENEVALSKVGEAAVTMVNNFAEFVKAAAASNDLKATLLSLGESAKTASSAFVEGFGNIDLALSSSNGGLKSFAESVKEAKVVIDAAAFALGHLAAIGIDVFVTFKPLRILFNEFSAAVTSAQRAMFGFTGVFDNLDNRALEPLRKLADQANVSRLGMNAFGASSKAVDPLVESYKNLGKELPKVVAGTTAASKAQVEGAKATVEASKETSKAVKESLDQAEESERNAYANKQDRLDDYRANYDSFSAGLTTTAQRTNAELLDMDKELAKEREKILADEVKMLESAQEDSVKAAREELDRQQKFLQEGLDYQAQYAKESEEYWKGLASTIVSSLSSSVSAWSAIAEEENAKVAESAKKAAEEELKAYQEANDGKIEALKAYADQEKSRQSDNDSGDIERFKAFQELSLQEELKRIDGRKQADLAANREVLDAKIASLKEEADAAKSERQKQVDDAKYPVEARLEEELIRIKEVQREELKNSKELTVSQVADIKVQQRRAIEAIKAKYEPELKAIEDRAKAEDKAATKALNDKIKAIEDENDKVKTGIEDRYKGLEQIEKTLADNRVKAYESEINARQKKIFASIDDQFAKEKANIEALTAIKTKGLEADKKSESLADKKLAAASKTAADIGSVLEKVPGPVGQIGSTIAGLASLVFQLPEIMRGIPAMVQGFLEAIPTLILELIKAIPIMINGLIKAIPEVIGKLVDSIPEIVTELLKLLTDPSFFFDLVAALFKALTKLNFLEIGLKVAKGIWDAIGDIGSKVWNSLKAAFGKVTNFLGDLIPNMWGKGSIEKWLGFDIPFVQFADGGLVGGRARVKGDSPLNDTVPALLSPGEIVVPRSIVDQGMNGVSQWLQSLTGEQTKAMGAGNGVGLMGGMERHWNPLGWIKKKFEQAGDWLADTPVIGDIIGGVGKAADWVYKQVTEKALTPIINQLPSPVPEVWSFIKGQLRPSNLVSTMKDFIFDPLGTTKNIFSGAWQGLIKPLLPKFSEGGIAGGGLSMVSPGEMILPSNALSFAKGSMSNRPQSFSSGGVVRSPMAGIEGMIESLMGQEIVVQIDGQTVARAVRNQVQRGFKL